MQLSLISSLNYRSLSFSLSIGVSVYAVPSFLSFSIAGTTPTNQISGILSGEPLPPMSPHYDP